MTNDQGTVCVRLDGLADKIAATHLAAYKVGIYNGESYVGARKIAAHAVVEMLEAEAALPIEEPIDIFAELRAERERAHAKHGETSVESAPVDDPTGRRFRILSEEVGEIAKEFNDAEHDHRSVDLAKVRNELIQAATMAAAWADRIPLKPRPVGAVGDQG
jgi:hypothetical protein